MNPILLLGFSCVLLIGFLFYMAFSDPVIFGEVFSLAGGLFILIGLGGVVWAMFAKG